MEYYLAGALLRGAQVVADAAIWVACGCFIAAIFRYMMGAEKTRSLFGNNGRFGLLIGWGIGMLLPVCSLGVIPVVRELYRARVKPGTIVAFGLTAPLFNPMSILYGLSLSDPFAVVVFSAATMVIVTGLGALWGHFFCRDYVSLHSQAQATEGDDVLLADSVPTSGSRRSVAVLYAASTEMVGKTAFYMFIGVLCSVLISVLVPHGSLQNKTEPDNIFAPAFMAFYVTPVYSTPLLAMSQIGGMFQHGNSVGAAFALLVLGAGVNIGLLAWLGSAFGVRRLVSFLVLAFALTIGLAYAMDKPLYPAGVIPAGHTHAFDVYTHPYHFGQPGLLATAQAKAKEYVGSGRQAGVLLLVGLAVIGLVFRVIEWRWDLQKWFHVAPTSKSSLEIVVPSWVTGLVAATGLIIASIAGTFMYYPDTETALGDLSPISGNCVLAAKTKDWEGFEKWVVICDDLSRRLEVGVYLRNGSVSEFKRAKAKFYREKLNEIRDDINVGQTSRIEDQAIELHTAYLQMSRAFREE